MQHAACWVIMKTAYGEMRPPTSSTQARERFASQCAAGVARSGGDRSSRGARQ
jgi:hypothetical protein